jgi:hypothetical protein
MATAPCSLRRIEIVLSRIQHRGQYAPAGIELTASFDGRFVTSAFGELNTLVPLMLRRSIRAKARNTRGRYPCPDPALRHVAAELALHRGDARQAAGRAVESCRHRSKKCLRPAAMVEIE